MLKMFILRNSSQGPSYIIKSVDKTKLSCYTHTNATQVSLNPLLFCCLRVPVMVTSVQGIVYHWQNKKFPFMIPTLKNDCFVWNIYFFGVSTDLHQVQPKSTVRCLLLPMNWRNCVGNCLMLLKTAL